MERDLSDLEDGRTEPSDSSSAKAAASPTYCLVVSDGKDSGLSVTLSDSQPSPVLIGQSPVCSLRLSDPQVSRRHAAIEFIGNCLRVTDLDSTNGTFVSGVAIREAFLRGGESLQLGSTRIDVGRGTKPASAPFSNKDRFERLIGASRVMQCIYPLIERLSLSDVPIVIEGETGTGKEALAETIHESGRRASQPFVVFDCTTVPQHLLESELFGHERGSFTGAVSARKGCFEQANGGTLFIDEIGELDISLQPKLLRAIERSEVRRIGSERYVRVNVRVVAATRRNLDRMVQDGRFRDDLFFRLAVGRIELPPLRRRTGDIGILARHFWKELGGDIHCIPQDILKKWEEQPWPGNIRQLRNAVARQLALGDLARPISSGFDDEGSEIETTEATLHRKAAEISGEDFMSRVISEGLPLPVARLRVVKEFEQRYIAKVLQENEGNVAKAAKASGIARRYFQILRTGERRAT